MTDTYKISNDATLTQDAQNTFNTNNTNNNMIIEAHRGVTEKIDTTILGVRVTFGFCSHLKPPDTAEFSLYVEESFAQMASTNARLNRLMHDISSTTPQQLSQKSKDRIELENSRFVEYMTQIIQITKEYNPNQASTTPTEAPTQSKPVYKFKPASTIATETAFERQWRDHFQQLSDFKNTYGHCNVSRTTKGFEQLGNWLADQRRKLRRGKMTELQYQMLSGLGVEWDRSYYFIAHTK
mmetsp:Transcript_15386/g.21454  ORF Transcript_15386/g.21454 Transcript_15386/m.21454 type:complete len:239 (+) Transcript_15386:640-1356(+)